VRADGQPRSTAPGLACRPWCRRRRRGCLGASGCRRGCAPGVGPALCGGDGIRFWEAVARGASSEDAASEAGVSSPVGSRWFRQAGGMSPISLAPLSGRYLSFAEREEIAIGHAQHLGVREIAVRPGPFAVDGLAGTAAQRIDAQLRGGVPGDDCTVARRAACEPPKGLQACGERRVAQTRAEPSGWHDHQARR
jgi:hypothetical protein